jgi:hypothetical protein
MRVDPEHAIVWGREALARAYASRGTALGLIAQSLALRGLPGFSGGSDTENPWPQLMRVIDGAPICVDCIAGETGMTANAVYNALAVIVGRHQAMPDFAPCRMCREAKPVYAVK